MINTKNQKNQNLYINPLDEETKLFMISLNCPLRYNLM